MSNFIIRQQGPSSAVADNIWEIRLGAGSLLLGALAGGLGGMLVGLYLGRRGKYSSGGQVPENWPVNIAHRGGAGIAPENPLDAFRKSLQVGAGVLELDVHLTADGRLVVIHDDTVDRTTNGKGLVREMTLREIKDLDAGYCFTRDDGETFPYRGKGVTVPTLEEVYREFPDVPINVEIKEAQPNIEQAVWKAVEEAAEHTLIVSERTSIIRRFRKISGRRVKTGSSVGEIVAFNLLSRLRLNGLLGRPAYQALQGPETYRRILHIVTPGFVRAAHESGVRVDVWTINTEPRMRRVLGYGVDGIMTDYPDVLNQVLEKRRKRDGNQRLPQG